MKTFKREWVNRTRKILPLLSMLWFLAAMTLVSTGALAADDANGESAKLQSDPGYSVVQGILAANAELADQRKTLLEKLSSSANYRDELQSKVDSLVERYDAAMQIVDAAGDSSSVGRILMDYSRKVDQFHPANFSFNVSRELGDQVIRRAEHERQLAELVSASSYIQQLYARQALAQKIDAATHEIAIVQIRIKRSHLDELVELESQLVVVLSEVERILDQLNLMIEEYTTFLTSHILWVASHSPVGKDLWKQLGTDARRNTVLAKSITYSSLNVLAVLGLVLSLVLTALRKQLVNGRKIVNRKIGRPRSDSARYTFFALLLTALQAAALPLFLVLLVSAFKNTLVSTSLLMSNSLTVAVYALFLTLFLRTACDEHGVARVHFGWAEATCDKIFSLANWALFRLWPLMLVTSVLVHLEADSINAVLGRLVYCATALVLGYKIIQILRSRPMEGANDGTTRKAGIGLVFLSTLGLVVMVLSGYMLPARVILFNLIVTMNVVIVLVFTYHTLMRWLLVTRRQLRFRQLVEDLGDQNHDDNETELTYEPDLIEISETAGELLKSGAMALGTLWLLYVWSPLLPAFQGFRRITLWTVSKTADGVEAIDNITLATLLLAILIGAVTVYAARKLPSLLELFLRSYSPMAPGTRYAAVTVLNYLIIGSGLIFLLSTLGLRWEKLQWLVAALSVGIGFGLQEIVANFISGLVILFERPIRVGDFVTVGEYSGRVTRIQIRATTILDFDRKDVLVPNKEFVTGRLLNWTLSDELYRIVFKVGIAYGSDVEKAMKTLQDVVEAHEEVLEIPEPSILFTEFGDSSLTLTARCFIASPKDRLRITSELHQRVDAAFRKAGIEIAFPQRDLHFDTGSPLRISIEKPGQ